ncbi:MAG: MurR/RpiR family transcriptional regulator, partial [Selenomonadaceae bacterium]|nr:MurR/RpiR family transcriptional regulator [Selenomonadaceae bacterium]
TRLSANTLASLSTVNLYILPASFANINDAGNTPFLNLMPFFLLVEFLYLNCRIYIEQQEKEFS